MSEHPHSHEARITNVLRPSPTSIKITVEFDEKTVANERQAFIRHYATQAKIAGFRPGKVPPAIIADKFKDQIIGDTVSHLVEVGFHEAVAHTKVNPVNRPKINILEGVNGSGKPFKFEVEFEVRPEIELRNYKGIPLKNIEVEPTADEIQKTLDRVRERHASLEPLESLAGKKGDFAIIELSYKTLSEPIKSEPAQNITVELGAESLLPELEKAFLEMKVGETKDITAKFPEDFSDTNLKGREASFNCRLLELKKKVLPDLDDNFASLIEAGLKLEDLKKKIVGNIRIAKEQEQVRQFRNQMVDHLVKGHQFQVPHSLIERQTQTMVQEISKNKKTSKLSDFSPEDQTTLKKRAELVVRSSLLLQEIAVKENLTVNEEKLKNRVERIAQESKRSVVETEKLLGQMGAMDSVRDEVLTEQVFDFLLQNAQRS